MYVYFYVYVYIYYICIFVCIKLFGIHLANLRVLESKWAVCFNKFPTVKKLCIVLKNTRATETVLEKFLQLWLTLCFPLWLY